MEVLRPKLMESLLTADIVVTERSILGLWALMIRFAKPSWSAQYALWHPGGA